MEGVVYRLRRDDLEITYVGQTVKFPGRMHTHKFSSGYTSIFWLHGVEPVIDILGVAPRGEDLDVLEHEKIIQELDSATHVCVNMDVTFQGWGSPEVRLRANVMGAKVSAIKRRAGLFKASEWRSEESYQRRIEGSRKAGLKRTHEQQSAAGKTGGSRSKLGPAAVENIRRAARVTGATQGKANLLAYSAKPPDRQCDECGKQMKGCHMTQHLKFSGHSGWSSI